MDQQTLGQLYATLYSDLKPEPQLDTVRPLLAHYTSLSTVEAIIRGDQIWFSNPLLMNDFEEVHFGIVNGNATITNSTDLRKALQTEPRSSHFFQKYLEAFSAFDLGHLFDTYVSAFPSTTQMISMADSRCGEPMVATGLGQRSCLTRHNSCSEKKARSSSLLYTTPRVRNGSAC